MKKLTPAQKAFKAVKVKSASKIKKDIQAVLRQLAIKRDGGCVLRNSPEAGQCGGYGSKSGELILTAEHLNSRANNVSYADMRNIVCLCSRHHFYWKPQNSQLYWELIEKIIGEKRWAWYKKVRDDKKSYPMSAYDWGKILKVLEQELKKYDS